MLRQPYMLARVRTALKSASTSVTTGVKTAASEAVRRSRQATLVAGYAVTQARTMTRADMQTAAGGFASGFVLGDFSKDVTVAAHLGRAVGGVIPFYGAAAAARDCVSATHRLSKGEKAASIDLALGVLSFFPGARLAVNALRGAQTAMNGASRVGSIADEMTKQIEDKATASPAPSADAAKTQ